MCWGLAETGKEDEGNREGCLYGGQDDLWKKKCVFIGGWAKFNIEILLATLAILTEESSFSKPKAFFYSFVYSFHKYLLFMYSVLIIDFVTFITVDSHLLLETLSPSLFSIRLSWSFAQITPGCGHTLGQFDILFFSLITLSPREILLSSTTLCLLGRPLCWIFNYFLSNITLIPLKHPLDTLM